jgi:cell division protein FtsW
MSSFFDKPFAEMNTGTPVSAGLLKKTKGDKYIWGIVVLLAITSLLVVYSATGSLAYKMYKGNTEVYLFKQFAFISIGMAVVYFAHRINYTIYSRIALYLFLLSIPLMIFTYFFGATINDGSRWIKLPIINMTCEAWIIHVHQQAIKS